MQNPPAAVPVWSARREGKRPQRVPEPFIDTAGCLCYDTQKERRLAAFSGSLTHPETEEYHHENDLSDEGDLLPADPD